MADSAPAVSADGLRAKLTAEPTLAPVHVSVEDVSGGCGASFVVKVVSASFDGKPLLARHRAVTAAIADEVKRIHAITLHTWTPAQWDDRKAAGTA
jgi:stress-induced morphogen